MISTEELDNIKMNFIIGPGRSGTTLLTTILNEHEDTIAAPEIKHLIFLYSKYKNIKTFTNEFKTDFLEYLKIYLDVKKIEIFNTYSDDMLDFIKVGQKINFAQLVKLGYFLIYKNKTIDSQINFIVDKNPFYTFYYDILIKIFPDAKFLVLIRDYRAYVNSIIQNRPPFSSKRSIYYYAYTWKLYANEINKISIHAREKIMIIKYEDFVLNKEFVVKKVQKFIGLNEEKRVLNFHENMKKGLALTDENIKPFKRMDVKLDELSSPVKSDRIERWKQNLSKKDLEKIEMICGQIGLKFDYELTQPRISRFKSIMYKINGIVAWIRIKLFYIIKSPKIKYLQNKAFYRNKIKALAKKTT